MKRPYGTPRAKQAETSASTRNDERGVALILTLLILTLLVIIVFQVSYTTKVDIRLAKNRLDTTVLQYATDGVLTRAMAYIQADGSENQWDARGDLWESASFEAMAGDGGEDYDYDSDPWGDKAESEGQVELDVVIIDEDRKLNIALLAARPEPAPEPRSSRDRNRDRNSRDTGANAEQPGGRRPRNRKAEEEQRQKIFEALISVLVEFRDGTSYDLTGTESRQIAEAIRDWVTRPSDNKDDSDLPHPPTIDPPMLSIDEILMIEGVTEDLLFDFPDPEDEEVVIPGLLNFVTIWSSGLVNINTAPPVVLRGFFGRDKKDLVDDILEYRDEYEEPEDERPSERRRRERESGSEEAETPGIFKETSELQSNNILDNEDYQDLLPFISTQSSVFSVHVTASRGKVELRTRAIVRRVNGGVHPVFYDRRKDKPLFGRDLEDEDDDEGGFF